MVVYIAITSLLTMRISSFHWKMTANIDMRKQSWQCCRSLILRFFLILRLYDTRFFVVLFHVHNTYCSRITFWTFLYDLSAWHTLFHYLYTIYSHVHNVAFTFKVSKVFIGIHISCLQLQLSMLCNEMVFRRSWYAVIHW